MEMDADDVVSELLPVVLLAAIALHNHGHVSNKHETETMPTVITAEKKYHIRPN